MRIEDLGIPSLSEMTPDQIRERLLQAREEAREESKARRAKKQKAQVEKKVGKISPKGMSKEDALALIQMLEKML